MSLKPDSQRDSERIVVHRIGAHEWLQRRRETMISEEIRSQIHNRARRHARRPQKSS